MGQRIASLFAEIGADTTGLKRGLKETERDLTRTQGKMEDMGDVGKKAFLAVAGAAFAAKKAFDFGKAGAQLDFLSGKFARLANRIGTTADVLDAQLKSATRGMLTESERMALAVDLLALKMAKTQDEAVRLSVVVAGLNLNINEMVLAIANQTTRRFDQLGIAVDGFDEKLKKLEATGLSTEDAFKEAFLQQAEEQLGVVGHVADSTLGTFVEFEVTIKDFADTLKRDLLPVLEPVVKELTKLIKLAQSGDPLGQMAIEAAKAAESYEEYREHVEGLAHALNVSTDALSMMNEEMFEAFKAGEQMTSLEVERWAQDMATGIRAATMSVEQFDDAVRELEGLIDGQLDQAASDFKETQRELLEEAARLRDEIAQLEGRPLTDQGRTQLYELRLEMENVRQQIIANAEAFDEQTKRMVFDILVQRAAMADMAPEARAVAFQILNDIALAWGLIGQQTYNMVQYVDSLWRALAEGNIQEVQNEMMRLKFLAEDLAGDYFINFHVQVDYGRGARRENPRGTPQDAIDTVVNDMFTPGSFTPPEFTLPKSYFPKAPKVKKETEKTIRQAFSPMLEAASALSTIGSMFADRLQKELIEPLEAKIRNIDALLGPGHVDMTARERSAELMAERAEAAQKIVEAEAKILKLQEAQQRLQLLEQQIKLLDLIKQHDLDGAGILEGLKLGIDADAVSVVEAMTKALNAIIDQTRKKLKLGSPSRLYFDFGRNLIQGLRGGIDAELPSLLDVTQTALGLLGGDALQVPASATMQGESRYVFNIYPSEGMDEEELARKVSGVIMRQIS